MCTYMYAYIFLHETLTLSVVMIEKNSSKIMPKTTLEQMNVDLCMSMCEHKLQKQKSNIQLSL